MKIKVSIAIFSLVIGMIHCRDVKRQGCVLSIYTDQQVCMSIDSSSRIHGGTSRKNVMNMGGKEDFKRGLKGNSSHDHWLKMESVRKNKNRKKGKKGKNTKNLACNKKHTACWSERARHLTNTVRRSRGIKPLNAGTYRQLQNALKYAKRLGALGFLKHQNLREATRQVGCNRFVAGENIAFNYVKGDLVQTCVKQWIHSKGHFKNLVREWFEEVVVGVFEHKKSGRVYCVQTFAVVHQRNSKGKGKKGECRVIGK